MSAFKIETKATDPKSLSSFDYWYLQYCLTTGLYMLEPWERKFINSVVVGGLTFGLGVGFQFISAFV